MRASIEALPRAGFVPILIASCGLLGVTALVAHAIVSLTTCNP